METDALLGFLQKGGPALWVIAALSVLTLALILWKLLRLLRLGAWAGHATARAVDLWSRHDDAAAQAALEGRGGLRARLALAAMCAAATPGRDEAHARE